VLLDRCEMVAEIGGEGEHSYVLMLLCALEDPGLTVFPTHRLLDGLDDEKRAALVAHAKVRGFDLGADVSSYLLTHARRDMGSLISALDAIDRYSLETGRAVTVPLLKSALVPSPRPSPKGEGASAQ